MNLVVVISVWMSINAAAITFMQMRGLSLAAGIWGLSYVISLHAFHIALQAARRSANADGMEAMGLIRGRALDDDA